MTERETNRAERIRIVCPKCDAMIATVPRDFEPEDDLVCPNCGATVRLPGALDRLADEVSEVVGRLREKLS